MNDPWPRFKSFVFCTMIFIVFGTLMNWAGPTNGDIKGIDELIGKIVFLLAVISIALILLVQKLDFKWITRISVIICFCLLYYIGTMPIRYDIPIATFNERIKFIGEGVYFTLVSSIFTVLVSILGGNSQPRERA